MTPLLLFGISFVQGFGASLTSRARNRDSWLLFAVTVTVAQILYVFVLHSFVTSEQTTAHIWAFITGASLGALIGWKASRSIEKRFVVAADSDVFDKKLIESLSDPEVASQTQDLLDKALVERVSDV